MRNIFLFLLFVFSPIIAEARYQPFGAISGQKTDIYGGAYRAGGDFESGNQFHSGIDIHVATGTVIFPVSSGTITYARNGLMALSASDGKTYVYGHVTPYGSLGEGDVISSTQPLARVANHPILAHMHLAVADIFFPQFRGEPIENPLDPTNGVLDNPNPQKAVVSEIGLVANDDTLRPGFVTNGVTPVRIAGDVDVVALAYEPLAHLTTDQAGNVLHAGIHQISYRVENVTYLPSGTSGISIAKPEQFLFGPNTFKGHLKMGPGDAVFSQQSLTDTDEEKQDYYYIVSNSTQTMGGDFTKEGAWNTKASNLSEAVNTDIAKFPEDAKFPDGNYRVRVRAAGDNVSWLMPETVSSSIADGTAEVTVDNFRPYVKSIIFKRDGVIIYERTWTKDGLLLKSPVPTKTPILKLDNSQLELEFSEPVKDLKVSLGRLAITELYSDDPAGQESKFHAEVTVGMTNIDEGEAILSIEAKDKQGNKLLKVVRDRVVINPATELTRDTDGVTVKDLSGWKLV